LGFLDCLALTAAESRFADQRPPSPGEGGRRQSTESDPASFWLPSVSSPCLLGQAAAMESLSADELG
jgi:hypothetical protein